MIIAFRHGLFPLNERSHLTGEAAMQAMEQPIPPDVDATMDLLQKGYEQGHRVQNVLAGTAIYACLRSETLRTASMAKTVLAGHDLPGGTHVVPELRERSRGVFSYAPDEWSEKQSGYPDKKSVLDWKPAGVDYNGNRGESIRQVRDTRVEPVLEFANDAGGGKTVAFSTHAEWMLGLRAYYLGFDDVRFRLPLVPNPPRDNRALTTSKMVINGQFDMFDCACTGRRKAPTASLDHADVFRTVITEPGLVFDSGWLKIRDM